MARVIGIAYDDRNQMVEYTDLDNLRTHRYHYDRRVAVATCFGRRVAKVTDHESANHAVTRYAYGGQASWQVLAEFDGFQPWDTAPLATYVFGNYISKSRRGDDEPIQMRRDLDGAGPQQPQDFYYQPDDLFSIVALTNAGGAVVERVRYGDYGNVAVTDASGNILGDTSTIGNRFAFTGREYDEETDLSYYRTRYLEHEWGRFTTRDMIGVWGDRHGLGSANAYCGSRPSRFVDPLGLASTDAEPAPPTFGPFVPLNGPELPLPPVTTFTPAAEEELRRGLRGACKRARDASDALNDPEMRRCIDANLPGSNKTDLDKLKQNLDNVLAKHCSGRNTSTPVRFEPDPFAPDPYVREGPEGHFSVPIYYPVTRDGDLNPNKDHNQSRPEKIIEDILHELMHKTNNTPDPEELDPDAHPGDQQHNFDVVTRKCSNFTNQGCE